MAQGQINRALMRLELTLAGLLIKLANYYMTGGVLKQVYLFTVSPVNRQT